jgi:small-conductance mechanosensitive channel
MNDWLSPDIWQQTAKQTLQWLMTALPSLLLVLLFAFAMFRALGFGLNRLKKLMLFRKRKGGAQDVAEVEKQVDTLLGIVRTVARITIWSMIVMIMLRKLGVDIAPLIAGAGIAGLAVGFGAQELVRDVISGFFMLLENQIRKGDVAIINGTGGLVEDISLRTITLRDLAGVVHVIQNGKVNSLSNMTKEWSAMVFDVGVAYKEDTDNVVAVMTAVAADMQQDDAFKHLILEPMEIFGVDAFADSAVVIKARIKTRPISQWAVGREYRRRLKKAFDEQGIEIPFPHRTVYWGEASKPFELLVKQGATKQDCAS